MILHPNGHAMRQLLGVLVGGSQLGTLVFGHPRTEELFLHVQVDGVDICPAVLLGLVLLMLPDRFLGRTADAGAVSTDRQEEKGKR